MPRNVQKLELFAPLRMERKSFTWELSWNSSPTGSRNGWVGPIFGNLDGYRWNPYQYILFYNSSEWSSFVLMKTWSLGLSSLPYFFISYRLSFPSYCPLIANLFSWLLFTNICFSQICITFSNNGSIRFSLLTFRISSGVNSSGLSTIYNED